MNKIGIFYAYWVHDWDADFVPLVSKARKLGFDILEVMPTTVLRMGKAERNRLKEAAAENAIELTYCMGLPQQYDVASPDRKVRAKGIEYLKELAAALVSVGGKALCGILYGWWPTSSSEGEQDKRACLDRSIESMKEVMKVVEDYGFIFNLEVVNRFEQFLLNTAQEAVEYVERVGSSHCKILLDTFHMNIEEDSFSQAIATAGDKLGHFHMGETNRRPPGKGKMPWDEIMGALHTIGYQGPVVMEPFLTSGGPVARDIRVYRDLREGSDLDEEARKALIFVRNKLAAFSA
jgi:D-psicose/D-tagatose/L-ribulose 3-epimerase